MSDRITIISGLPRSGTSAMMQMLVGAGMEALTDDLRTPDKDNPKGYYELEIVQKLKDDASWVEDAQGKVVKVVSPLLKYLPDGKEYDLIFMRRDLDEIIASQSKMIEHRGSDGAELEAEQLTRAYKNHLKDIYIWMGPKSNIRVVSVNYRDLIDRPSDVSADVANFLGGNLDPDKMAAVVDADLYRNRATSS
ncbi:Uncharacterised protein [Halioglobus japonicus]|nr:Uncharacterised protein [Halioglobus japonicus]